ncbi:MAG: hypothetical protein Q8S71_05965 [Hydrogenophaga sp.]|jgi:hypothetical protein|uniref:hypothetical protein n=1 Tax=Hydrogenophaga sp. TaxID=1904254 RepID=UPI00272F84E2|nr:hypothetical protein [Hydrogenophaga sp.]MDP2406905.1 hypothetical protein [Hydrogenophaga sp.]MDP3323073.1 hypothetical protein [Hydrogenophaga sp.]MDZ4173887.1 hypothetical protein [Hydrogenophaga sp.]
MALADTFVKQVKHSGKPAGDKHTGGDGMYLLVMANMGTGNWASTAAWNTLTSNLAGV